MNAPAHLRIDIWSDVMCPWCIIGYKQLQKALGELEGEIEADISWHPFELNRDMPEEGEDMGQHMLRKYGTPPEQAGSDRMAQIADRTAVSIVSTTSIRPNCAIAQHCAARLVNACLTVGGGNDQISMGWLRPSGTA